MHNRYCLVTFVCKKIIEIQYLIKSFSDLKLVTSHRYEQGIRQALIDANNTYIVSVANNGTLAVHYLDGSLKEIQEDVKHYDLKLDFAALEEFTIMHEYDSKLTNIRVLYVIILYLIYR